MFNISDRPVLCISDWILIHGSTVSLLTTLNLTSHTSSGFTVGISSWMDYIIIILDKKLKYRC